VGKSDNVGTQQSAGGKSCSFWADNFDGIDVHLAQRLTFVAPFANRRMAASVAVS
jgi:predicted dithiol-disulfide oxidoreductase (DUF899 family)